MTNEVSKLSKNSPVKMTKKDAMSQIEKAENLIEVSRPKYVPNIYEKGSGLVTLWFVSFGVSFSALVYSLSSVIYNDYSYLAPALLGGILSIAYNVGIPFTQTREIEFFNKKSKFRKLLRRMFLDKKIKKSVTEALEMLEKNEQMKKIHQVLINKVLNELESSGAVEVINDFRDPENDYFVNIDRKSGDFRYLTRKEIEKEMGMEPDPLSKYQKLVLEVVSNDKLLADKDFKELFS